jgi:hypothetical protein
VNQLLNTPNHRFCRLLHKVRPSYQSQLLKAPRIVLSSYLMGNGPNCGKSRLLPRAPTALHDLLGHGTVWTYLQGWTKRSCLESFLPKVLKTHDRTRSHISTTDYLKVLLDPIIYVFSKPHLEVLQKYLGLSPLEPMSTGNFYPHV